MVCLPRVTVEGVYRIKVKNHNRYLELDGSGRIKLVPRQEASDGQLWKIMPRELGSFEITNELDDRGLTFRASPQAGQAGYPFIQDAKATAPTYWTFSEGSIGYQKFSRISVVDDPDGYVLDSRKKGLGSRWVHLHHPKDTHENQQFEFELGKPGIPPCLDLLFLQDTTCSQGPYIEAAVNSIETICQRVASMGQWKREQIRMGLVAFRDYPPQEDTYITQEYDFTTEISTMKANLRQLKAEGGGDGPEAQTAALDAALNASWRDDGAKIAILITDSPPHGICEDGDGIPDGDPKGRDPIQIVRRLAKSGVTLYVLACEPTLSLYQHALDFYRGLVSLTGGSVVPLINPDKLAELVINHTQEAIQVETLISQYGDDIAFQSRRPDFSIQRAAVELFDRLQRDGVCLELDDEETYLESDIGDQNAEIWATAKSIAEAHDRVTPVLEERIRIDLTSGKPSPSEPKTIEPRPPTLRQTERLIRQVLQRNS